eukprot:CAMPEP_0202868690 /NCGR_PEP_ID=MMETSP1391-20130828/11016_1 /ASSEMBLY_ACC=CAM_ASM_000867 /TAXON_ID=1034604 /ORGANISM="Chlamydomonas leiostraca, Strain SAG 11-49" /LENGTH=527 /DNA_ID=CAMNT_0049548889 /DNA_START=201 /DNA_END=1784 /DNA_ORIENTATION=-
MLQRKTLAVATGRATAPVMVAPMVHRMPRQAQRVLSMQAGAGANPNSNGMRSPAPAPTAAAPEAPSAALVRRPTPPQLVFVDMSQVVGKQVITRTTGRNLGTIGNMWVDPVRYEVVSLDLEKKEGVQSTRIANFPLSRLTQIGDVVLVHDDSVLYDQPLDGRYGYYLLAGMEVKTRSGEFLGKVRDCSFSPDSGAISRVVYDDFGLSFLPVSFFDTFSLSMSDVLNIGPGGLIVPDEAKYRERRESQGLFAAIPSLLRSVSSGGTRVAGALTDGFRQDSGVAGYLPSGYSYEQWEMDIRRWEQETGLNYDQYIRSQQGQAGAARGGTQRPAALPSPRMQQPQQPAYGGYAQPGYGAQPQQPQYGGYPQQPAMQQQPQPYGAQPQQRGVAADPRYRAQQPQDPRTMARPQQPAAPQYGAAPAAYGMRPQQPPAAAQPQQPMRPQQQPADARPQQPAQPQQQQQGQAAQGSGSRAIDEWMVRDERPREAVMEGWPGQGAAAGASNGWDGLPPAQAPQQAQPQQQPQATP